MKKFLLVVLTVSLCMFASCASKTTLKTNYVPPSTTGVSQSVTTAQEQTTNIKNQADKSSKAIAEAAVKAKSAQDRIVLLLQATKDQPTIQEMVRLVGDDVMKITLNLATAKDEIVGLQLNVQNLESTLGTAKNQITTLKTEVGTQTQLLNDANRNANAAMAQSAIDKANAHRFKAIIMGIAVLAVAAVLFGVFGVKTFVPPILWLLLGLPTIVGVFLFFYLGS